MGMYTELNLGVRLKEDLPEDVISALKRMVSSQDIEGIEDRKAFRDSTDWPDHPFFKMTRSRWCLHSCSYYFDAQPMCQFKWDEISKCWYLTFVANIKNYALEWQSFIDWLTPHIDGGDYGPEHIGHYRYEEDEYPTILMLEKGKVSWVKTEVGATNGT